MRRRVIGSALAAFVALVITASPSASGNPYFSRENGAIASHLLTAARIGKARPASPQPIPVKPVEKRLLVVLDPGHGGKDAGAVSPDGALQEKDVVLTVARRLKRIMEKAGSGVRVFLTRDDDSFLSLKDRTALANSLNADLFISIHCNSNPDSSARGVEAYYLQPVSEKRTEEAQLRGGRRNLRSKPAKAQGASAGTPLRIESARSAQALVDSICRVAPSGAVLFENRGVRRAPMNVLFGAKMPAVLLECGFMSNKADRRKLKNRKYLNYMALSMARGILDYFRNDLPRERTTSAIAGAEAPAGLRVAEGAPR